MKNIHKIIGIIAFIAVIALGFGGCTITPGYTTDFINKNVNPMDPVFGDIPLEEQAILVVPAGDFIVREFAGQRVGWGLRISIFDYVIRVPSGTHTMLVIPYNSAGDYIGSPTRLTVNFEPDRVYGFVTKQGFLSQTTTIQDVTPDK